MGNQRAKEALYDGFAGVAKAMASGRRLEVIDLLAQAERSVDEIAKQTGQSVANTSHHLRALARAGLVRSRRDGTRIIYALTSDEVWRLWEALRTLGAAQVAEIERLAAAYIGDRSGLEPVSREELARRLRRGDVLVLDVRPNAEYAAGHIRGATSMPLVDLKRRMRSLGSEREIVAYCRGPYCVFADEAVRSLVRRGFRARRLEDGWPQWRLAGLPTASLTELRSGSTQ